jgi:hypothetical protein
MTAYQAVRPAGYGPLPQRRRLVAPVRRRRRIDPVGIVLAGVALFFMLGRVNLGQTVTLGATNYEYERLVGQRDDLTRQVKTAEAGVNRFAAEQWVLDRGSRSGLAPLGSKLIIPAR